MKPAKKKARRGPAKGKRASKAGTPTQTLIDIIRAQTDEITRLLDEMAEQDAVEISDLLQLQMMMNMLSQMTEATSSILSAMNATIQSMARNIK
jgi:hypothetical protein